LVEWCGEKGEKLKAEKQILIGQLATIPTAFVVLFIVNQGVWPMHLFRPDMAITVVLLASYIFFLSRNWLRASLAIISFITVIMIAGTWGEKLLIVLGLSALLVLYQGIIGVYRIKSKQMNIKQHITVWSWVVISFIMGFVPPWSLAYTGTRYGPIWSHPIPDVLTIDGFSLNGTRLVIQWLIVALAGCILIHLFQDETTRTDEVTHSGHEVYKVTSDKCRECGRKIRENERACIVNGELVCSECEQKQ
jgi:hypothetical protein